MTNTYNSTISLKNSCRDRLSTQVQPSFSQRTFLLSDFTSPDFIDSSLLKSYQEKAHNQVEKIQRAFDSLRNQINTLETQLVQKMMAGFNSDTNKEHELESIHQEMKLCHERILEGSLDTKCIDELAHLLNRYEEAYSRNIMLQEEKKIVDMLNKLENLNKKINSEVGSCKDETLEKIWDPVATKTRDVRFLGPKPKRTIDTKKEKKRKKKGDAAIEKLTYQENIRRLVLPPQEDSVRTISLHNKNVCPSWAKTLKSEKYVDALNLVVRVDSDSTFSFYRPDLCRLRRITSFSVDCFFPTSSHIGYEIPEESYLMVLFSGKSLKLINTLTRRAVQSCNFESEVCYAKYIRNLNCLFVALSTEIRVYRLSLILDLSMPVLCAPIKFAGCQKVYIQEDLVQFQSYDRNLEYDKTISFFGESANCYIDCSKHIFDTFQGNRVNFTYYKNIMKSSEYGCEKASIDYTESYPEVSVENVTIDPKLKRFKVMYKVGEKKSKKKKEFQFEPAVLEE